MSRRKKNKSLPAQPATPPVAAKPWARRFQNAVLWSAGLFPVGLVLGNVVFEALAALTVLFWLLSLAVERQNPIPYLKKHPLVIPWLAWYCVIVLSLVVNGPGSKGAGHDVAFVRDVLFGFALLDIGRKRPELARFVVRGMAGAVILAAFNTVFAHLVGFDPVMRPLEAYTKKLGISPQISGVAIYAVSFFGVLAACDAGLSVKSRRIYAVIAIIAMLQLFQIHSRTPIAAAFCGLVFGLWRGRARGSGSALGPLLAGVFLGGAVATVFLLRLWDIASVYDRLYIWKVSWGIFLDNPILGVGVSSFRDAFAEISTHGLVEGVLDPSGRLFQKPLETHAHNLVLMLLSSTGILGLLAFGWLFVRACGMIWKAPKGLRLGLAGWPVALLVLGISGENIYYSWYHALVSYLFALAGSIQLENAGSLKPGGVKK